MELSNTSPDNRNSNLKVCSDKWNSGKRTNDNVEVTSLFDVDVNVLAGWRVFERVTSDERIATDGGESTRCASTDESHMMYRIYVCVCGSK